MPCRPARRLCGEVAAYGSLAASRSNSARSAIPCRRSPTWSAATVAVWAEATRRSAPVVVPSDGEQGPADPDHDDARRGGSPVSGRCPRHPDRGERQQDEGRQGGHPQRDGDEDGADAAHAVAQDAVARADVRRVGQRVERAVEADQHADVECLQQGDDREGQPQDGGDDGPGPGREDEAERDEDDQLEGYAGPGSRRQLLRAVRQVERRDEQREREDGDRDPLSRRARAALLGPPAGWPRARACRCQPPADRGEPRGRHAVVVAGTGARRS